VNPEQLLGYASNNVADEHHILGFDDA